jgi:hypothetical protein
MPLTICVALCAIPFAQAGGICSDTAQVPRHDFQFFAGYSPSSPTLIGSEPNRRLVIAGFAYSYRCWESGSLSLSYTGAVLPLATLRVPAQTIYRSNQSRQVDAHSVYGFGIEPLGFTVEISNRRLHPFVETMGGVIASTEPIPENQLDACGLNFMFDFGGGIRYKIRPLQSLTFGYKFLHISNAGTTSFNPGVDNNVVYVGYSFSR